jgi:hypothetical protein
VEPVAADVLAHHRLDEGQVRLGQPDDGGVAGLAEETRRRPPRWESSGRDVMPPSTTTASGLSGAAS